MTYDFSDQLLHHAQVQMHQGNRHGAIQSLKRLLGLNPDHALAHGLLSLCLLQNKRLYAAEHEAGIALQLEPEHPFVHYILGHIALANRRFKVAESHFQTAIQLEPGRADYHLGLAAYYRTSGDRAQELKALERALALEPDNEECLAEIGEYYLDTGKLEKAEEHAHSAMQLNPDCLDAIVLMGSLYLARGNVKEARAHALWALHRDPTHVKALRLMSGIKARTNWFLGLWWRFNTSMSRLGEARLIFVVILMFLLYRVATQALKDFGLSDAAFAVSLAWLAFVVYTWVGPALFNRSLEKELKGVSLREDF